MPKSLSKGRQIFLNAASFPAIIFFQIWVAPARSVEVMTLVAAALLAYSALVIALARLWDKPGYFDWAIAAYFFMTVGALLIRPDGIVLWISHYAATGVYACLFAAAFFPPLFGLEPFTCHFAKKSAPPETWGNPVFVRINLIMTFVWAGIFAVGVALSLFPSHLMRTVIPNALMVGIGIPFNRLFPDYYLKRLGLPSRDEQQRLARESGDPKPPL